MVQWGVIMQYVSSFLLRVVVVFAATLISLSQAALADTSGPTVSIAMSDTEILVGQTSLVTFTFNEAVKDFTNSDLTSPNGTLSPVSTLDDITWTATFTPNDNVIGAFVTGMKLDLAGVEDAAGNAGVDTISGPNYVVHTAAISAEITLADPDLTVGETTRVTIAFNMVVYRFNKYDIRADNATFSDPDTDRGPDYGRVWYVNLTPTAEVSDQTNAVVVALGAVEDWTGRTGPGDVASPNYTVNTVPPDTVPPTVAITVSDTDLKANETSAVTFTFDEVVSGFNIDDITVGNGTLTDVSSEDNIVFTAVFTPSVSTTALSNVISVGMSGVSDLAGNTGFGATDSNSYAIDTIVTTDAPVADAGGDQTVASQAVVFLSATGSHGNNLTYHWSQSSGPTVVLSDASAQQPSFTAPTFAQGDAVLVFSLIVNDGAADSAPDTVTITVEDTIATVFNAQAEVIDETMTDNAISGLSSAMSANQTMMQAAKGRFISGANQNVALDVDGNLNATAVSLSTMGTFFGQSVIGDGARRLVFGSFDIQRDVESGTSTATFSGKISWERTLSDKTMMGYFIGSEVAQSTLKGSFTGDQDHLGLSVGGYGVHELAKQVYLDGFVSLGAGRNNLTMTDGVLDLDSDYSTRSASFGTSLSGVIAANGYEILPELSLSVGRTWIGAMDFTGTAYGVIDNSLSIDAGMVTLASLTFRPEIRLPLDGVAAAQSQQLLTFAPRLICQQIITTTTAQTCGRGAEVGLQTQSADGMTTAAIQIKSDLIDGKTSSTAQIRLEYRF